MAGYLPPVFSKSNLHHSFPIMAIFLSSSPSSYLLLPQKHNKFWASPPRPLDLHLPPHLLTTKGLHKLRPPRPHAASLHTPLSSAFYSCFQTAMFEEVVGVSLFCYVVWLVFRSFQPPPPRICGEPGGPPVTGPRITLRDGRYLSYKEHGVAKETAKCKMVFVHGTSTNKHDAWIATSGLVEELGAYIVSFDRPGYGESTPHPNRTMRSTALDIEDLADQLGLGPKFYIVGYSMGGQSVWGCLKYIPHRLAGATLAAPVINYWWPCFPEKLRAKALSEQLLQDQFALRVTHYAPWLVYWWNSQSWFSGSSVLSGKARMTPQDIEFIIKSGNPKEYSTKQGLYESYMRDMMIGFGKWEFDPMDLEDPFPGQEGAVHLWHGSADGLVPVMLQRHIAGRLPWIQYHEIPKGGHLFCYANDVKDAIFKNAILKTLPTHKNSDDV